VTAGPVDRIVIAWQSMASAVLRRLPWPIRLAVIVALLGAAVVGVVTARAPLTVTLLTLSIFIGLIEVAVVGLTRTISVRALFITAAIGGGLITFVDVLLIGGLERILDLHAVDLKQFGGALINPLVNEALKVAPAVIVILGSRRAASLSVVDVGLLGFATGIGYSLTEEVVRSGSLMLAGLSPLPALLTFPADPYGAWGLHPAISGGYFSHGLTAACVALAIGMTWRAIRKGRNVVPWALLTVAAYLYVVALHSHVNASTPDPLWPWLLVVVDAIGRPELLRWLALGMAGVAIATDYFDLRWVQAEGAGAPLKLLLPLPQMRVERLATMRRVYELHDTAPDIWSARTFAQLPVRAAAGVAVLLVAGFGLFTATVGSGSVDVACLECFWDPRAGIPWWFLLAFSLLLDFIPGVGDVKGVIEGATGEDMITGEKIPWWARVLGAIPLLGGLFRSLRGAGRVARAAGRAADAADAAADGTAAARRGGRSSGTIPMFRRPDRPLGFPETRPNMDAGPAPRTGPRPTGSQADDLPSGERATEPAPPREPAPSSPNPPLPKSYTEMSPEEARAWQEGPRPSPGSPRFPRPGYYEEEFQALFPGRPIPGLGYTTSDGSTVISPYSEHGRQVNLLPGVKDYPTRGRPT
jgi:putative toxin of predicted polymorphic toxin system